MRLAIDETWNNFELYIGGEPLQKHLSEGTLFFMGKNGEQYRIASKDISVRLNNWDRIKASILTNATMNSFVFGMAVTLLMIGLIQAFSQKKKP